MSRCFTKKENAMRSQPYGQLPHLSPICPVYVILLLLSLLLLCVCVCVCVNTKYFWLHLKTVKLLHPIMEKWNHCKGAWTTKDKILQNKVE